MKFDAVTGITLGPEVVSDAGTLGTPIEPLAIQPDGTILFAGEQLLGALTTVLENYPKSPTVALRGLGGRIIAAEQQREVTRPLSLAGGNVVFSEIKREFFVDGRKVHLTETEQKLLALLGRTIGIPQPRDRITQALWGRAVEKARLNTHVNRLRKKLGPYEAMLQTERRFGYVLRDLLPEEITVFPSKDDLSTESSPR